MADYPKTTSTKRSSSIKVMLHPDMAVKLRVLAEELGQAPATIASIAVSQYVLQQTRALVATERAMEAAFSGVGPEVVEMIKKLSEGQK
jgi:predicted transcriptional regulator